MSLQENQLKEFVQIGRCGAVATLLSLVTVVIGFWGYAHNVVFFQNFGLISHHMHPLTGIGIFSCGISLFIRYYKDNFQKIFRTLIFDFFSRLPLVSIIIGFCVLIQLLIKRVLWFNEAGWEWVVFDPVKYFMPAPEASICLMLGGFSVLALDSQSTKIRKLSETFALIFFGLTLLSFAQLLTGADKSLMSYLPIQAIGMALPTAFSFLFLVVGVFCYQPRIGYMSLFLKESIGADLARRLVLKVIFFPILIEFLVGFLVEVGLVKPMFRQILPNMIIFCFFIYTTYEAARELDFLDSARKKLEITLSESEEKYRTLIELAPESIFVADLEGKYVTVNDAAANLLKTKKENILGKTIFDLISTEDYDRLYKDKEYLLDHGNSQVGEWKLKQFDGNFVSVEVSAKILSHNRWIAFVRNIEERKRAEAIIKEAEARAQRASTTREELIAIVSHDLRTPLTTINLGIQKLNKIVQTPKDLSNVLVEITSTTKKMSAAVKRSTTLISNLLTFAKIESGTFALDKHEEEISSLINETIENHILIAREKGIQLFNSCEINLKANLDRSKIIQVISNLISNAIKFTPSGGSITVLAESYNPDFVVFKISDTGTGINREQLEKIFDRYWQPEKSHSDGAGLGLSIVKGIVEAHKGKIWVESELGSGTTFLFTLPTHHHN